MGGLGILTGGRDIPERYLPRNLGVPMVMLRAGLDFGTGESVFGALRMPGGRVQVG